MTDQLAKPGEFLTDEQWLALMRLIPDGTPSTISWPRHGGDTCVAFVSIAPGTPIRHVIAVDGTVTSDDKAI